MKIIHTPVKRPGEKVAGKTCAFRPNPLTLCLLLSGLVGPGAHAKDYFDPSFLSDGSGTPVDLSAYETEGSIPEGTYLVDIYMNQRKQSTQQVRFAKDDKGDVIPALTPAMLKSMGVANNRLDKMKGLPADKPVGALDALIPGATVNFTLSALRLDITVPQVDMDGSVADAVDPKLWDEGVPALLFSYNLNGSRNRIRGNSWGGGSTSQSVFGSANGGVNLGPWRLRSSATYSRNETQGSYHYTSSQFNTGDTYLERDVQRLRGDLIIGESSTGGNVFDSILFRGVKLASNDAMLPSSQRGFAPVITGTARSNARVTVTQNGNPIYETNVPPGPFRLTDVYSAGNGGELLVTVTEADGSRHISTQTYSTLPVMKRTGSIDYEVTAGRYRNGGYTTGSRDPIFAMATTSVGLPHYVTLFGGLLGSSRYKSAAAGVGMSLGGMGAISVDATYARATLQAGNRDKIANGASFRARYSKSMMTTGTSVDLTAYRYSTNRFFTFQDAMSSGYSLQRGYAPWMGERRRSSWQMNVSQTIGKLSAISMRASRDDYWGSSRVVNSLGVGFSSSIKGVGYAINYNIDHTQKGNGQWPTNRQLSLNVSVPFSIFSPQSDFAQSINANYSMTHDNHGRTSQQAGLGGSLLDSRMSWNVSQSAENQGSGRSGNMGLGYSGDAGNLGLSYGYTSNTQTWSGNASGGVVVHPHGIAFTRMLGDSMALIEAPGADGVKVMSGNATTDSRGYAVVPYLQNDQPNSLSLDPTTLPDGVDVNDGSVTVYPTRGAVVEAQFKTRVGRQAMLTLNYYGKPVPFGAIASLPGDDASNAAIVGDGGMVYLTGAPQSGVLKVSWGDTPDRQCRVNYDLGPLAKPKKKDPDAPVVNIVRQTLNCEPDAASFTPAPGQARPEAPEMEVAEHDATADQTMTGAATGEDK